MNGCCILVASLVVLVSLATVSAAQEARVATVRQPPTDKRSAFYPSNREPLAPSPFVKLPIGAIRPKGWLRHMLQTEAEGMSGRLTEISPWCKAEGNAWLSPEGKGHSPWEEMPYWLKGFGDLGYVLGDERILKEARRWIEGILSSPRDDGWFGPRDNLTRVDGKPDVWPNMVALNCLQSYHEFTGDKRVIDLMTKYFRWQMNVPKDDFIPGSWQKRRGGDNLESIYWLYNRTGEAWLLDLARKVHERTDDWTAGVADWHGVNICQGFREPALFWMQAREDRFRQAAYRNYETVIGLFGQVPGGMFGADENCRKGYDDPRQGAETCSIVEFMHSFEMLTRITGYALWADRCEEAAFNSLPCAQPADMKSLKYLTAPNQTVLDAKNHAPGIENSGCMLAFNAYEHRCCQHNVAMGWPYYAEELWLATPDGGLAASLYAACEVRAKVGDGTAVTVTVTTDYPFGETVALAVATPKAVRFPLYLRIPRWCQGAKVAVNGKALDAKAEPLSYVVVERTWSDGDRVDLALPMRLAVRTWPKNHGAVSVDYGPLTFALKIGERWQRYGGTDAWPAFEVFPITPWNYGLVIDPAKPGAAIEVAARKTPVPEQPFTPEAAPIELKAKARRIPDWGLDRHGLVAVLQDSPLLTREPVETVTLIPMGCARLRISAFPVASDSPGAHPWQKPPTPDFEAMASHCNGSDSVDALSDGQLPKTSDDASIPRFTWWDHRGTAEWVVAQFGMPRTVSEAEVYWFDDTGRGQCRIPESWRLLYKEGGEWRPVKPAPGSACGTAKDTFNKVSFEPVATTDLRLEVRLQGGFSGGILEWRIGPKDKK